MRRPSRSLVPATLTVAALMLAGCGGGDSEPQPAPEPSTSTTPTETQEPDYLPVPVGTELAPAGSELAFGESAVVATEFRQQQVGVLEVEVTSVERTSFDKSFQGLDLSGVDKGVRPYFVRAKITNADETGLGDRAVPLYLVDGEGTLVEATGFAEPFRACPSTALPKGFAPGDRTRTCLVYLAMVSGDEVTVAFRPDDEVDLITWAGSLESQNDGQGGKKKGKGRNRGAGKQ